MQIAVPFFLPIPWLGSLESILRLDHPLMAYTLSPLLVAVALAVGYAFRVTARAVAAASRRRVPRPIYGLAGLCLIAAAVILARLSYAESHAAGNAAISITFAFLALYSTGGAVLCAGRSFVTGPRRLAFWVFLPRWVLDSGQARTAPS
jgi:hypothetical protein